MAKKPNVRWYPREWRKKLGWTLEKASNVSGIGLSYLSDLEKGRRRWNVDHLEALAAAYGIDGEDLLWNPEVGPPLWRVFKNLNQDQREHATKILETFIKKAS